MLLSSLEAIKNYKVLECEKYKVDQIPNKNVETIITKYCPLKGMPH